MKTVMTKPKPSPPQEAKARFLEVRAGRLRTEEPTEKYSARLALSRRIVGPTD
jgi:hypothetical protein